MNSSPTILVIGATGTIGSGLIPALRDTGATVRAMIRDPERPVPGVDNVVADLRDGPSLETALDGVHTVFLNSPSTEDAATLQIRAADRARAQGVGRLVVLSQYGARPDASVRFLRWHGEVEEHVRSLDIDHTVLRPNLYLQSLLGFTDTIAQGILPAPVGEAAISAIDTRDIADSAAAVLTGPGHTGRTYTLTGPRAITHHEIAESLSRATGTPIAFQDMPPEHFAAALTGILPPWQIEGLVEDFAHYARGEAAEVHSSVADLTGRAPRDVTDFARDHAAVFARPAAP